MFRLQTIHFPRVFDENPDRDPTLTDSSREFGRRQCFQKDRADTYLKLIRVQIAPFELKSPAR